MSILGPTEKQLEDWVTGPGSDIVVAAWQDCIRSGANLDLVEFIEDWDYMEELYLQHQTKH